MKPLWLMLIIVGIVGVMLLAGWIQQPKSTSIQNAPISMKIYKDPDNVYMLSVPSNWQQTKSTATSTTGLKTARAEQHTIQVTQFTKPAEMGVTIQVISGQPSCPLAAKPNSTLAGLPAFYNPANYTWTIPTTTQTVLVSVAYPGTNSFHHPPFKVQPTPFPAATVEADKQLVKSILNSLRFSELKPLMCK